MDFLSRLQAIETFVTMFSEYMNNETISIEDRKKFLLENQDKIKDSLDALGSVKEYILGNDDPDDDKYIFDVDKLESKLSDTIDFFSKIVKEEQVDQEEPASETETKIVKSNKKRNSKTNLFTHTIVMSNGDCFNLVAKTKKDLVDAIISVSNEDEGLVVEAVYKVTFEQVNIKKKVTYTIE